MPNMHSLVDVKAVLATAVFATLLPTFVALEVATDSPCGPICIDQPGGNISDWVVSSTQTGDVLCHDSVFGGANMTAEGSKWRSCLECELASDYWDSKGSGENDAYWALFNMKFTLDWCVFGTNTLIQRSDPDESATACAQTCAILQPAMTAQLLHTDMDLQYLYCDYGSGTFSKNYTACRDCLQKVPTAQTLSLYMEGMNVACKNRTGNGTALNLGFDPIATTQIAAFTASATSTSTSSPTSTPSSTPSSSPPSSSSSGLSPGAAAGIGVAVGVVVLAAIATGIWLLISKRRREAREKSILSSPSSAFPPDPDFYRPPQHRKSLPLYESKPPISVQELGGFTQLHEIDSTQSPGELPDSSPVVTSPHEKVRTSKLSELE